MTAKPCRQRSVTSVDGVRLAVREWGRTDGPSIVFIHGWSHCQSAFLRQFDSHLAETFRLISFDLRGHGDSDHPCALDAYDNGEAWSNDLHAVIAATDAQTPVLVGWSFGGRIIGHYLQRFGTDKTAGANLVSVAAFADPGLAMRGPDACADRMVDQDLETVAETAAFFVRRCANTPLTDREFHLMFGAAMSTSANARKGSLLWHADYTALCRTTPLPVLVTHGAQDSFTLPVAAQSTTAKFPNATLSLYEDSGHMPFWDNAARFNAELAAFALRCAG